MAGNLEVSKISRASGYYFRGMLGERQIIGQHRRGNERIEAGNAEVVGAVLRHDADRWRLRAAEARQEKAGRVSPSGFFDL